jgi:hypothetical protein
MFQSKKKGHPSRSNLTTFLSVVTNFMIIVQVR